MLATTVPLRVFIYMRVSTDDQKVDRQRSDLREFCRSRGYIVVDEFEETASGAKNNRKERAACLARALAGEVDAVVVTELTRWGRSTVDLLDTVRQLNDAGVSLKAQTGMEFDLETPQGKLMLTIFAGMAEFERDLIRERIKSGMREARAQGKQLGRESGYCPSDKKAKLVLDLLAKKLSLRAVAKEADLSVNSVRSIAKRHAEVA